MPRYPAPSSLRTRARAAWRDPVYDGRYDAGLIAHDHKDTLDPSRKQVPYGAIN